MNCTFSRCQKRGALNYYRNHSLHGATLFSKLDSNKLRFNVKNEMTLICAKFDPDLINILKLQAVKQSGPGFLAYPLYAAGLSLPLDCTTAALHTGVNSRHNLLRIHSSVVTQTHDQVFRLLPTLGLRVGMDTTAMKVFPAHYG